MNSPLTTKMGMADALSSAFVLQDGEPLNSLLDSPGKSGELARRGDKRGDDTAKVSL